MQTTCQANGNEPAHAYDTRTECLMQNYYDVSAPSAMRSFDTNINSYQNHVSGSQNMHTGNYDLATDRSNLAHQPYIATHYGPLRLDCGMTYVPFMDNSHWNTLGGVASPLVNNPLLSQSQDSLLPEQSSTPGSVFPGPSPITPFSPVDSIYEPWRPNLSFLPALLYNFDTPISDLMPEVIVPPNQHTPAGQTQVLIPTTSSLPLSSEDLALIHRSFPSSTLDHHQKKIALTDVMQSEWKRQNAFEENENDLLQFMRRDVEGKRWHCTFWQNGRPCPSSCRKKDHAKGHIRNHIGHRPFACQGACPSGGLKCDKRYPAVEPLNKHQRGTMKCPQCGVRVLRGNLSRHQASDACR